MSNEKKITFLSTLKIIIDCDTKRRRERERARRLCVCLSDCEEHEQTNRSTWTSNLISQSLQLSNDMFEKLTLHVLVQLIIYDDAKYKREN